MNFAAAVGDLNPVYFNDEAEAGIVAPPLIAVSLTWPFGIDADQYWDAERFPLHLLIHQVHYTETLEFYRLMRPGDQLTLTAQVIAMKPHRAGTHVYITTTAVDEHGLMVFKETAGTLLRNVTCLDSGGGEENVPLVPKLSGKSDPVWEGTFLVSPVAAHIYDGAADIHNPIHTSVKFAKAVGLPGTIVHGTYTLAVAAREVVNRMADGDPGRLKSLSCRFTGMVLPGTEIVVRIRGTEPADTGDNVYFEVINAEGRKAISYGHAFIAH